MVALNRSTLCRVQPRGSPSISWVAAFRYPVLGRRDSDATCRARALGVWPPCSKSGKRGMNATAAVDCIEDSASCFIVGVSISGVAGAQPSC